MPPLGLLLLAALLAAVLALASCAPRAESAGSGAAPMEGAKPALPGALRVLVLTGGGYHDFTGNPVLLMQGLSADGAGSAFAFTTLALGPQDAGAAANRARLDTLDLRGTCDVILDYTQGDLGLSPAARERLLAFVREGGGFVGLHCAADSHPGWDEYDTMLGGRFESHPPFGPVAVRVDVADHPVTRGLPAEWALTDEFYHLKNCATDDKQVLMSGVSPGPGETARRPVTWVKTYGSGRVVYTILGHGRETHGDARFRKLVAQALAWAAARPETR